MDKGKTGYDIRKKYTSSNIEVDRSKFFV